MQQAALEHRDTLAAVMNTKIPAITIGPGPGNGSCIPQRGLRTLYPNAEGWPPVAGSLAFDIRSKSMSHLVIIFLGILFIAGCRRPRDPAPPVTEITSLGPHPQGTTVGPTSSKTRELDDRYDKYDKAVVILKTGEKVPGYIYLGCPAYFRVCHSPDGHGPLIDWSDVQTVLLEESWDHVNPTWRTLQEEMTILTEQTMDN